MEKQLTPPTEANQETAGKSKKEQLKAYLYENFIKNEIMPTPIKPYEICVAEAKSRLDKVLDNFLKEIIEGEQLFRSIIAKEEKDHLEEVLARRTVESTDDNLEFADEQFLEKIAKNELAEEHNKEAGILFLTLIHLYPEYSSAWVGYAIAQQQLNRNDKAEQIYLDGMELMPWDDDLKIYAAQFYLTQGKKEEAKKIIEEGLNKLKTEGNQEIEFNKRFTELLEYL